MATQSDAGFLDLFAALAAPFEHEEVRVRPQGNQKLQYVTARVVMNRLDDVLGPSNWWDEYIPQENSVICKLTIRLPDGSTLTKSDAGGYAGMSDQGDDDKSGFSDAFKRAAVKFGIGRYLYRDGIPRFVKDRLQAAASRPAATPSPRPEPPRSEPTPAEDAPDIPRSGKALFAWLKQQDEKCDAGLLRIVSDWAKRQDFPARMVEWDADQVRSAFDEAARVVRSGTAAAPAGGADRATRAMAPAAPPAPTDSGPKKADVEALLVRGSFAPWLDAFVAWANSQFAAKRGDLPTGIVLVTTDMLASHLRDRLVNAGSIPRNTLGVAVDDALLKAMSRVFDADPQWFQAESVELCKTRSKVMGSVGRGMPGRDPNGKRKEAAARNGR